MWAGIVLCCLLGPLRALGAPAASGGAEHPLALVAELTARLDELASRAPEPRLLPTPQDIEGIRKVAQILVAIGEKVIPAIIGELPGAGDRPTIDVSPNDPISLDKLLH